MRATPHQANRVVATLSKAMNFAIARGWRTDNPCRGVERNPESRRQRFLSQAEIVALGKALDSHTHQGSADAIRFLLLTGARRGEALSATWSQLDLEKGVWLKPSAHTKQAREHRVPLSAPALALLVRRHNVAKDPTPDTPVFPGRKNGPLASRQNQEVLGFHHKGRWHRRLGARARQGRQASPG
jgi:integrase